MELLDGILLKLHIIAGFISLFIFLVPMMARKGSDWHRRSGIIYVYAMWIVIFSALSLSVINFIQGQLIGAIFLGFLAILTANPLWYGIGILKQGKNVSEGFIKKMRSFELIIFFLALMLLGLFVMIERSGQSMLLLIFGLLGLTSGFRAFRSIGRLKAEINPIGEHIQGLLSSAIAAYTAFLVFGAYTFFAELYQTGYLILFWTLPGVIGGFAIAGYRKRYTTTAVRIDRGEYSSPLSEQRDVI